LTFISYRLTYFLRKPFLFYNTLAMYTQKKKKKNKKKQAHSHKLIDIILFLKYTFFHFISLSNELIILEFR
jgi:hypothetical protein